MTLPEQKLNWAEPIPLIHEYERSLPYPIQCLPSLIQEAVIAFHHYGKQPLSLIALIVPFFCDRFLIHANR